MQCVLWLCDLIRAGQESIGSGPLFLSAFGAVLLLGRLVLRLPWAALVVVLAAPAALFLVDHPYTESVASADPRIILAAGWAAALSAAVAVRFVYLLFKLLNPFGPRATPIVALTGTLCLLLLLLIWENPQLLEAHYPGWRQTWGIGCLAAAGIALAVSCFRCVRFMVPLVFWGALFGGLAGYVVYDKSPAELWRVKQQVVRDYLESGLQGELGN